MLCRGRGKGKALLVVYMSFFCGSWIAGRIPDGHAGSGDLGELHGPGETLVTLGIVVLEADLELDSFEEVAFLLIGGVLQ